MTIFDRFNFKVVACAGLCGAAIALSPQAAAVPLKTDGYACIQGMAGEGGRSGCGGRSSCGRRSGSGRRDMRGQRSHQ